MCRVLLLICLLGLVAGQCDPRRRNIRSTRWPFQSGGSSSSSSSSASNNRWPFGRASGNSVETGSAEIARKLIDASRKMHDFCVAHSNRPLREVYGVEHYQLRVTLNEFSEDDIQVVVRHRLVVLHAQNCPNEYAAVRILPDIVDPKRAVWKLERGVLTVLFPYNVDQDSEIQSRCGREVSEEVIIVPKCPVDTHFDQDYDLTFGDANFRKAILGYLAELAKNKGNEGTHDNGGTDYIDSHVTPKKNNAGNLDFDDDIEMVVQRSNK